MSTSIHRRTVDCEVFEEGPDRMRVRGRLTDNRTQGLARSDGEPLIIHDMVVDLIVVVPGFEIVDVETAMEVHPYEVCTNVLPDYQQLVGLTIGRGYNRRIKELFGGPGGCSHIGALLQAMGPAAIQASWSLMTLDDDPADRLSEAGDDEDRLRRLGMNVNTCHVWAEGGDHMTAVSLGDSMRPDWETERMQKLGVQTD